MAESVIDPEALKRYSFSVWSYKQGEIVSLMIHLGDRLGLYRALNGAGPVTAAELADRTGLKERWLFEWLRGPGGRTVARLSRSRPLRTDAGRGGRARRRIRQPRIRGGRVRHTDGTRDRRQAVRCVPHRHRPQLRTTRRECRASHRADARPLGAPGAGTADRACARRRAAETRTRLHRRGRRLRQRTRARQHGRGISELAVPRLRPEQPRNRQLSRKGARHEADEHEDASRPAAKRCRTHRRTTSSSRSTACTT